MGRDFSHVKRIVIKAGTNILSSKDGINMERVRSIVDQIAAATQKTRSAVCAPIYRIGLAGRQMIGEGRHRPASMEPA